MGRSIVATRLHGGPPCSTTSSGIIRPAGSTATSSEKGFRSAIAISRSRRSAVGKRGDHQSRTSKGSTHSADDERSLAAPATPAASTSTAMADARAQDAGAANGALRRRESRSPRLWYGPLRVEDRGSIRARKSGRSRPSTPDSEGGGAVLTRACSTLPSPRRILLKTRANATRSQGLMSQPQPIAGSHERERHRTAPVRRRSRGAGSIEGSRSESERIDLQEATVPGGQNPRSVFFESPATLAKTQSLPECGDDLRGDLPDSRYRICETPRRRSIERFFWWCPSMRWRTSQRKRTASTTYGPLFSMTHSARPLIAASVT